MLIAKDDKGACVRLLLQARNDAGGESQDHGEKMALMVAAADGKSGCVQWRLQKSTTINSKTIKNMHEMLLITVA